MVVLNLAPEPGETAGFSPEQHLAVLSQHAPGLRVDAVLADVAAVPVPDRLHRAAAPMLSPGGRVRLAPVAAADPTVPRHDPAALAEALAAVLAGDPDPSDPSDPDGRRRQEDVKVAPASVSARLRVRCLQEVCAMAMTAAVKDELSRLVVTKPCCRRAEVAALLRFAGGLHIVGGRVVIEAEVDTGSVARRLRREIHELYGHTCEAHVITAGGLRRGARYVMRVVRDGEGLARQTGLLDARGRPVRGLPPPVVSGGVCDAEAAWRGAFLAHGSLTEPGRSSALEVTCPGPEAALALVGAARRLGVTAKAREVRGADRVVVRDGDAISALLTRMGAHESVLAWEERRMRREVRATANRLANFDDANLRRSARAAVAAAARVAAGAGDPRRGRPEAPAGRGPAARRAHPGLAGGARPARRPADDQGRRGRPDPPAAAHGRQAGRRPGHPGHRVGRHRGHARRGLSSPIRADHRWMRVSEQVGAIPNRLPDARVRTRVRRPGSARSDSAHEDRGGTA